MEIQISDIIRGNFQVTISPEEMSALRDYLNASYNFGDPPVFQNDYEIIQHLSILAKDTAETSIRRVIAQATKYETLQKLVTSGDAEIGYGHGV